jgi:hypothetical protein
MILRCTALLLVPVLRVLHCSHSNTHNTVRLCSSSTHKHTHTCPRAAVCPPVDVIIYFTLYYIIQPSQSLQQLA